MYGSYGLFADDGGEDDTEASMVPTPKRNPGCFEANRQVEIAWAHDLKTNVLFLGALATEELKIPLSAADVFVLANTTPFVLSQWCDL